MAYYFTNYTYSYQQAMKPIKLISLTIISTFLILNNTYGQLQISDKVIASEKDPQSILHLDSEDKGILPPKVQLLGLQDARPLGAYELDTIAKGMLVYNIGASIPEGYYYWDGGKWVRIGDLSEIDVALNPVAVTVSAVLDLEEIMIVASAGVSQGYRLNLYLPGIDSLDNGRTITLKHVGEYKDLIVVLPNTGKLLDNFDFYPLFRHESVTFMAWNGAWVSIDRRAESKRSFTVANNGSWKTLHEIMEFMDVHQNIIIGDFDPVITLSPGVYKIESTIEIDYPRAVTLRGASYGKTILIPGDTLNAPMFDANTEAYFKMLVFDATGNVNNPDYGTLPGHSAIILSGPEEYYEIKDFYVYGFYDGVKAEANIELWMFEGDIEGCKLRGFCFTDPYVPGVGEDYIGGSIKISEVDFIENRIGLCFSSGYNAEASIMNCGFYPGDSTYLTLPYNDIGINRLPDFQSITSVFISNNTWNNSGNFIGEGSFDFSRPDGRDANVLFTGNAGVADALPSAFINVLTTNTQSLASLNTWYYLTYYPTDTIMEKFKYASHNITYLSDYSYDLVFNISGTIEYSGDAIYQLGLWMYRGGFTGPHSISSTRTTNNSKYGYFTFFGKIKDVRRDDYFVIAIRRTSGGSGNFTLLDLQCFIESQ
jgi:hypothetical protein